MEYQRDGLGLRRRAACRTARIGSAAGTDFHAGHEGDLGPRHQHHANAKRRISSDRGWSRVARADAGAVPPRRRTRERARHHRRRHEVRVRHDCGRRTPRGHVLLIDEVLTPDSSRFWPLDRYVPGGPQPSFDKQYVRDYLWSIRWNKQPPVPTCPTTWFCGPAKSISRRIGCSRGRELE